MLVDKLTIHTHGLPKVVIKKPNNDLVEKLLLDASAIQKNRFTAEELPGKIKKKIGKEKHLPSFINTNCLVTSSSFNEDSRVLGAKQLNYLS